MVDPGPRRGGEGPGDQRLLVGEVVGEQAGGEPALAGDVTQRGRLEPLADDDAPGRLGDLVDAPARAGARLMSFVR
jgi:hypothetical protein